MSRPKALKCLAPECEDESVLQAPSLVQSGATLSTGQEALLQGYMLDNAAAARVAPAARLATVHACSNASPLLTSELQGWHDTRAPGCQQRLTCDALAQTKASFQCNTCSQSALLPVEVRRASGKAVMLWEL